MKNSDVKNSTKKELEEIKETMKARKSAMTYSALFVGQKTFFHFT